MSQRKKSASITVEAALVLPVFLFAALSVLYLNKLLVYEEEVQWALDRIAREASVEYAVSEKKAVVTPAYYMVKMKRYVSDDLQISMLRSTFDEESQEICLTADYAAHAPFPMISSRLFVMTQRVRTRAFTGVDTRAVEESGDDELVYVTKSGGVYHRDLSCSYLKLSISQIRYEDLAFLRSESGAKYYACESCCKGRAFLGEEQIFICNYGNRFHSIRSCQKITRSIRQIKRSETGGRLPCSKCGMEE